LPRRHRRLLALLLLCPLAIAPSGCAPTPAQEAAMSRQGSQATADVSLPPKQLVEVIRRMVSAPPIALDVESLGRGSLLTGWKRYRGTFHIAHYWQERTRFRIDVAPDFDEPTAKSHVGVTAETEQRAAEGQRWDREPRVPRPQRAQAFLKAILDNLPQKPQ